MISKDGKISKFPRYHSSEEEEPTKQPRALNKYGFVNHPELQRNEFASHQLPQREGNMNGWLIEDEDAPLKHEALDKEVDSDLSLPQVVSLTIANHLPQIVTQVTNNVNNANGGNSGNNGCTYKGFMACNPKEYDGKGVQSRGHAAVIDGGANHAGYTDRFHELAKLVPHLVTPESSCIKRYIAGLAPEIRGMLRATQPTTIRSAILKAGILTDEAVSCGILTKGNEKIKGEEESSKKGGGRNNDKRAKTLSSVLQLSEMGHFARNCQMPIKQVAPISAVRGNYEPGTYYECGSLEHYQNNCPKLTRAPIQMGNCLTIEGNWNTRNNENQVKGRAFNVNAVGALQDLNVMTGTFSLNHHYATVLFDSGADFSFISTDFAPLLNVRPSFVNPGYVIEVTDGKKLEVDRIIRDCKLELGTSLFTIDLIPLGHGSFNVIVGMD
ncbi:putative reverse transcriptase domain-containing protein [Tanacetum coccineum]